MPCGFIDLLEPMNGFCMLLIAQVQVMPKALTGELLHRRWKVGCLSHSRGTYEANKNCEDLDEGSFTHNLLSISRAAARPSLIAHTTKRLTSATVASCKDFRMRGLVDIVFCLEVRPFI